MPKNVGANDRRQRLIIGLILIAINLFKVGERMAIDALDILALAIQVELVLTGLVGWCPLYWSFAKWYPESGSQTQRPPK